MKATLVLVMHLLMLPAALIAQSSGPLPTPTVGWNMGNTLEPPAGPGAWGPLPTQAMLDSVVRAGFNTVRIPCAWNSNADQSTYQISPTYMALVKQMVDWCLARNLYVIINDHWDGGWMDGTLATGYDPTVNARVNAYWTQISNTFQGYDNRLLFAAANEPPVSTAAEMTTLMTYYQTFVNTVRATGGANANRWLVVQGPSADIDTTNTLMTSLPSDSTPGRLVVEVHYYSPYQFTLMTSDATWGNMFYFWGANYHSTDLTSRNATWGEESYLDAEFQKMTTQFVNNGIPVIIGEFRAAKRSGYADLGTAGDSSLAYASTTYWDNYVVNSAHSHGLGPICWDTPMNLFDSNTGAVLDAPTVTALTGGAPLPVPVPDAPSGLKVSGGSAQASLSWTASQGHVVSYNIYRATVSGGEGVSPVATGVTGTTFTDTGLKHRATYYYRVAAVNASGTSPQSGEASARTR